MTTNISNFESEKPTETHAKFLDTLAHINKMRKEFTIDTYLNKNLKQLEEMVKSTFESFKAGE